METTRKINVPQFFLALFVAQATAALAFNAQYAGGPLFLDNLLSCLLALGLGLLLALPSWGLLRRWERASCPCRAGTGRRRQPPPCGSSTLSGRTAPP